MKRMHSFNLLLLSSMISQWSTALSPSQRTLTSSEQVTCETGDDGNLYCPKKRDHLIVFMYKNKTLTIQCQFSFPTETSDLIPLYAEAFDHRGAFLESLILRNCPLINTPYSSLLEQMNVSSTKRLELDIKVGSNDTASLNSNHFRGLHSLMELEIGRDLTSINHDTFQGVQTLKSLSLVVLRDLSLPSDLFKPLSSSLEHLKLQVLSEQLPEDLLHSLSNLKSLDLTGSKIKKLPDRFLFNLTRLEKLNLPQIDEVENGQVFDSLSTLKDFSVSGPGFLTAQEGMFSGTSLETFVWDGNKYSNVASPGSSIKLKSFLKDLISLRSVRIANGHLYYIEELTLAEDFFQGCTRLEEVKILSFSLTSLPDNVFQNLRSLKVIDLESNKIAELTEESFRGLNGLEVLVLAQNEIEMLSKNVFTDLKNLRKLDLNKNKISKIDGSSFRNLAKLEKLDLSGNNIVVLSSEIFQNLRSLKELDLSSNQITTLKENSNSQGFFHSSKLLNNIDFSSNYITNLSGTTFKGLTNLSELHLNHISTFPEETFQGLTGLWRLYLDIDLVDILTPGHLRDLPNLDFLYFTSSSSMKPRNVNLTLLFDMETRRFIKRLSQISFVRGEDYGETSKPLTEFVSDHKSSCASTAEAEERVREGDKLGWEATCISGGGERTFEELPEFLCNRAPEFFCPDTALDFAPFN